MGSLGTPQNETESIAQFIQRLSQTSNIFSPGTGDAMGKLPGVDDFSFSLFSFCAGWLCVSVNVVNEIYDERCSLMILFSMTKMRR